MFEEALGAKTFIVYPYSSWGRGLNKNRNGLLGLFITKRTDLRKVTDQQKGEQGGSSNGFAFQRRILNPDSAVSER